MARVTTYLNFSNYAEEGFNFYKGVFRTAFTDKYSINWMVNC